MMMCPYNRKKLTQTILTENIKDDDGFTKTIKQVLQEEYSLMECNKDKCGVCYNNRCNYQVVQLNE